MLTKRQKKTVTRELRDRYQRLSKKEKTIFLNEFIQLTRYNRSYAARALRIKEVLGYMNIAGKRIKYVADNRKIKRKKTKIYDVKKEIAVVKKSFIFFSENNVHPIDIPQCFMYKKYK